MINSIQLNQPIQNLARYKWPSATNDLRSTEQRHKKIKIKKEEVMYDRE